MNFLFSTYAECQNIKNNHDFLEDYFSREIKKWTFRIEKISKLFGR